MNILILTKYYNPHIGGVEKHIEGLNSKLNRFGHKIVIITEKHDKALRSKEKRNKITLYRLEYPHIKFVGLLTLWIWIFRNRKLIQESNIVHCHDVFIWYLPFRFLYPNKPVYTTFHGWEGVYPVPLKNILVKRFSAFLSWGNICVGEYIEKYYRIKADIITYGAVKIPKISKKKENRIVFLGRLEKDTGVLQFIKFLEDGNFKNKHLVDFCGDGPLRNECSRYGTVHGFTDPKRFLEKARMCATSGYLSVLEAFSYKCQVLVFFDNPLKRDYWEMTPFYKYIRSKDIERAYKWSTNQTWDSLAKTYLKLWKLK